MQEPPGEGQEVAARGEVTVLLGRWGEGDRDALDELVPIVYGELRRLARSTLRRNGNSRTLEPTALVHELFVKLLGRPPATVRDRHHFFALAARVLRQLVVDQARERAAKKRGGDWQLSEVSLEHVAAAEPPVDVLSLHLALERLAAHDPELERLVEIRFFAGLTIEESAAALGRSPASIGRDWEMARAWLFRELGRAGGGPR